MDNQPQQPTPKVKPIVVHMDRSRDYATVHGDRMPNDPHLNVHFYQNGLPFNAAGILVQDHPEILNDEKKQAKVARLIKKAEMLRAAAPGNDADDEDRDDDDRDEDEDEDRENEPAPINLVKWAAGEQKVQWQQVSDAVTRKLSKRPVSKRDALEMLIEQRVVAKGALSQEHRRIVDSD